ncbi:DUF4153 domain-containing protein [Amniculibacterium sp. G2-70]|uniref:DUF4153 domain-containing protein n=1 Tax=Amniculibacterium sp. G2-70 TaxID=2767188 RepID=UPI001654498A|nr:DUF4153 domain-containing protein [Amniculibacterium sp. G2-70]
MNLDRNTMKNHLSQYAQKISLVIKNYPWVIIMALTAAVSSVILVENSGAENFVFNKIVFTTCLGISLMFAAKFIGQRWRLGYLSEGISLLLLLGFYFLLPQTENDFSEVYAFLLIPIYLISHLVVAVSSQHPSQTENKFWEFNKNLFINAFLTVVFTGVLIGGVQLAILAVDKLFNLNLPNDLYAKTFVFLAILGSCLAFLLFSSDGLEGLEKLEEYPKTLKFFTQFVLIPLLIVYAIILYFYMGKIILQWELPFGWVSYLILAYSVLGILALLLVHPLKEDNTKSWVRIFSKLFFYTLIPLIILLMIAIFTRIFEYGITEPRYFVLALAVWLSVLALYFVFSKKDKIQFIPISLMITAIFSIGMPYFNAFSVSKRSQKMELEKVLIREKILSHGKINFNKTITNRSANEITDKLTFLMIRKEQGEVKKYLTSKDFDTIVKEDNNRWKYTYQSNIRNLFTRVTQENNPPLDEVRELLSSNSFSDISDYHYMANSYNFLNNNGLKLNHETLSIEDRFDKNRVFKIKLSTGEEVDLIPLVEKKLNEYSKASTTLPEVAIETDLGNYHVKLVFERISTSGKNKYNTLFWGNYIVLIKEK